MPNLLSWKLCNSTSTTGDFDAHYCLRTVSVSVCVCEREREKERTLQMLLMFSHCFLKREMQQAPLGTHKY